MNKHILLLFTVILLLFSGCEEEEIAVISPEEIVPPAIQYVTWSDCSPPVDTLKPFVPLSRMYSKAKLQWFNNWRRYESESPATIWPESTFLRGKDFVQCLLLDYVPTMRGMYNYSPRLDSTVRWFPERNWAGIMCYLPSLFEKKQNEYVTRLILTMFSTASDSFDLQVGRMYINIGLITEDIIPNNKLNSEDSLITEQNPWGLPNGVLNPGEDRGLDMLPDSIEKVIYQSFVQKNPETADDPSGDNWNYQAESINFFHINGSEQDSLSPAGTIPDTEDLNLNGSLDLTNIYLEYEVPLDTTVMDFYYGRIRNKWIVGGGMNSWFYFHINLMAPDRIIGNQNLTVRSILDNAQYMRIWFSGFRHEVRVRIAEMKFVTQ